MGDRLNELAPMLRANLAVASPERRLDAALSMLREQRDVIDLLLSIFDYRAEGAEPAPNTELLAALRRLVSALEAHEWHSDMPAAEFHRLLNEAQDAIAKMEGRD